jgi:hypothetical protein
MALDIEFADGHVRARSEGGGAAPRPTEVPVRSRGRTSGDGGQGSLFG